MIKLVNVNKYFNKRKSNEIHVINNTTLELPDKGLVTFLGNSGCGKTTLLNAIGGLDKVNSGDIFIDNERLTRRTVSKKDSIRNAYIGYIFQNYNLIEDETVYFNVEVVLRMMGVKNKEEISKRVMFVLDRVGIARYKNRPVKALSGGERQRVGIARALVKNPKIIIADEPTGNLDSRNTIEIMNIIKAISVDRLVILVTHERNLAEFYASRIIEIVDGQVVSDKDNEHDRELDYRLENKIYLKDMPVQQEISGDGVKVKYYSDNPSTPFEVKVVVKNGNIYIDIPEGYSEGYEGTELVDDHYQKISKEVYEDYEFNYDDIAGKQGKVKYTSIFNWGRIILNGFKKVFGYSLIKKILLLGFAFAAAFTIYAVSSITGITTIKDEKFIEVNKNYLTVEIGELTPEIYDKYASRDDIDFVVPGTSNLELILPVDDYYQSRENNSYYMTSIAATKALDPSQIIYGKYPEAPNEVVLDKLEAEEIFRDNSLKWIGVNKAEQLVGRKINGNKAGELIISGIADTGSPCTYMDESKFFDVMLYSDNSGGVHTELKDYTEPLAKGDIELRRGDLPVHAFEVMVPDSMMDFTRIGKTIDTKLDGKKLIITGFYTTNRLSIGETMFVGPTSMKYAVLDSQKEITIYPKDKDALYNELKDNGIKVIDNYARDKKQYIKNMKEQITSTIIASSIILLISLIEIYLMLRSSFLSRIKEVGVLRAIGLKKRDVYKMFMGEIIAMTTITSLPIMLIVAYIINGLQELPYIGNLVVMNPAVFVESFLIVFIANTIFGLLPVFNTMRKTPAAILARNDIN